jgi:hypothetical protein
MTCYRCGKELPPGDMTGECEDGCTPPVLPADMGEPMLIITLGLKPRTEVFHDARVRAEFDAALRVWMHSIGFCFCESGLNRFCEKPPDQRDAGPNP